MIIRRGGLKNMRRGGWKLMRRGGYKNMIMRRGGLKNMIMRRSGLKNMIIRRGGWKNMRRGGLNNMSVRRDGWKMMIMRRDGLKVPRRGENDQTWEGADKRSCKWRGGGGWKMMCRKKVMNLKGLKYKNTNLLVSLHSKLNKCCCMSFDRLGYFPFNTEQ